MKESPAGTVAVARSSTISRNREKAPIFYLLASQPNLLLLQSPLLIALAAAIMALIGVRDCLTSVNVSVTAGPAGGGH